MRCSRKISARHVLAIASLTALLVSSSTLLGRLTAPETVVYATRETRVVISTNDEVLAKPAKLTQKVLEGSPSVAVGTYNVPLPMMDLYISATERFCPGLHWSIVAAVYEIESSHGLAKLPGVTRGVNFKGAAGPGQFLTKPTEGMKVSSWEAYGVDGNRDGVKNVYDPEDAVPGTANALCSVPAGHSKWSAKRVRKAVWWYNHADWYVEEVLSRAKSYRQLYG